MKRLCNLVFCVLLATGLGGCFHSMESQISAEDAVFPFEKFTYQPPGDEGPISMVRQGDVYVDAEDETAPKVRFKPVRDGIYVAEGEFIIEDLTFYAFTLVQFTPGDDTASVHTSDADAAGVPGGEGAGDGFEPCEHLEEAACFSDLDTYVAYALKRVDDGEAADHEFKIIEAE